MRWRVSITFALIGVNNCVASPAQAEFEKIVEEFSVADRLVALEQLMADHDAGIVPL